MASGSVRHHYLPWTVKTIPRSWYCLSCCQDTFLGRRLMGNAGHVSLPLSLFMSVSSIFVRRIRWNHWCGGVLRGQAVYITIPRRCPARCHLIRLQNLIDIEMFVLCVLYKMLRSIITGSWWHVYCCFRLIVHCYR